MNIHIMICMDVSSRAADWKLDTPDWSGRMRITARGKVAFIKLEDKVSGKISWNIHVTATAHLFPAWKKTNKQKKVSWMIERVVCSCHSRLCPLGELFAQAPVKEYPGVAVETVSDSSRYFVLRIQDDNGEGVNVSLLRVFSSQKM